MMRSTVQSAFVSLAPAVGTHNVGYCKIDFSIVQVAVIDSCCQGGGCKNIEGDCAAGYSTPVLKACELGCSHSCPVAVESLSSKR